MGGGTFLGLTPSQRILYSTAQLGQLSSSVINAGGSLSVGANSPATDNLSGAFHFDFVQFAQ